MHSLHHACPCSVACQRQGLSGITPGPWSPRCSSSEPPGAEGRQPMRTLLALTALPPHPHPLLGRCRYIKVVGGLPGREGLLVGLKGGGVLQVFVDNPFPVTLVQHGGPVRCLDLSADRGRLAVVDDHQLLSVYDLASKVGVEETGAAAGRWKWRWGMWTANSMPALAWSFLAHRPPADAILPCHHIRPSPSAHIVAAGAVVQRARRQQRGLQHRVRRHDVLLRRRRGGRQDRRLPAAQAAHARLRGRLPGAAACLTGKAGLRRWWLALAGCPCFLWPAAGWCGPVKRAQMQQAWPCRHCAVT